MRTVITQVLKLNTESRKGEETARVSATDRILKLHGWLTFFSQNELSLNYRYFFYQHSFM